MELSKLTKAGRKVLPLQKCGAVIVAAGSASRMGGIDKVMAALKGEPMIVRTVRAFQNCDAIKEIIIVTREDLIRPISGLCSKMDKVKAVVVGGKTRQESVWLGLNSLSEGMELAAIHDGARPLISQAVIDRTVRAAHSYGAAAEKMRRGHCGGGLCLPDGGHRQGDGGAGGRAHDCAYRKSLPAV